MVGVVIDVCILAWAGASEAYLIFFSLTHTLYPAALYYALFTGLVGSVIWWQRDRLRTYLGRSRRYPLLMFLALGYGMVLFEEVVAALAHTFMQGFSLALFLLRVEQFWAFNVLAFTGFLFGWYLMLRRFSYSDREVFYTAGVWGIYAEHLYQNPAAMLLLTAPTILTYGLIISPAALAIEPSGRKHLPAFYKYVLTYIVIIICSILPTLLRIILRIHFPGAFPPAAFT